MRLCTSILGLCFVIAIRPPTTGEGDEQPAVPQWIWSSENAAEAAPAGRAYFRMLFDLDVAESGRIEIAADNYYALYVNDEWIGGNNDWRILDAYDVSRHLRRGKNCIAVMAENTVGPAGLAVSVVINARRSDSVTYFSDKNWKCSFQDANGWRLMTFDDVGWKSAIELGEIGKTAPWGDRVKNAGAMPTNSYR